MFGNVSSRSRALDAAEVLFLPLSVLLDQVIGLIDPAVTMIHEVVLRLLLLL